MSTVTKGYSGLFAYKKDGSNWSVTSRTVTTEWWTVGDIAVVGWNLGQTPRTTSTSSTLSSITSLSEAHTPTTFSTTSSPTSTSDSAPGLTTGAAVGIGVGVGLGAIGPECLLASFWLIQRRRRRREYDTTGASTADLPGDTAEAKPAVGVSSGNMSQPSPSEVGDDGEIQALELDSENLDHRSAAPVERCG